MREVGENVSIACKRPLGKKDESKKGGIREDPLF